MTTPYIIVDRMTTVHHYPDNVTQTRTYEFRRYAHQHEIAETHINGLEPLEGGAFQTWTGTYGYMRERWRAILSNADIQG